MTEKKPAKKPQDRLPKKSAVREVELRGVKLEIDPEVFNDFEVMDALDQMQEGNALRLAGLIRKIVGDKCKEVMDALRDGENGRVPIDAASDFFGELMEAVTPN